jgi:hypothetical protein
MLRAMLHLARAPSRKSAVCVVAAGAVLLFGASVCLATEPRVAMTLTGEPGEWLGSGLGAAGDVNGDGYGDVILGAVQSDAAGTPTGRACVYYGGPSADAVEDVVLLGRQSGEWFGYRTIGADLNKDGYPDLVVGAIHNSAGGTDAGRVYIYFGSAAPDTAADVLLTGPEAGGLFGCALADAGDVNGDHYHDLLVGERERGHAYIFFGGSTFDAVADVTLFANPPSDWFGVEVSGAGDVNGDGYDDVLVGAGFADRAYVFFGGAVVDATPDLVLAGTPGDRFGSAAAGVGDFNGDGSPDLLVGGPNNDANGPEAGRAYAYFGGPDLDATPDWVLDGELAWDYFGAAVSAAGDVNRDGYSDIVVAAAGRAAYTGRAYVYYGGSPPDVIPDLVIDGEAVDDHLGWTLGPAGDVDGDGHGDVLIPAHLNSAGGYRAGRVYVVSAPFNTEVGDSVEVVPVDPGTRKSPVTLTFRSVTAPGQTSLQIMPPPVPSPLGFQAATPSQAYKVETTATITDSVEVRIDYSDVVFMRPAQAHLFQLESQGPGPPQWIDRTSGPPTPAQTVSGVVPGFSFLAVFEQLEPGSIAGTVAADCPVSGTPLLGVGIDAYATADGHLAGSAATDIDGHFEIPGLAAGEYSVTITAPLGYDAATDDINVSIAGDDTVLVAFDVSCVETVSNPRSVGFWKHQVGVALGGNGQSQIDGATLCGLLDLIHSHFNSNEVNEVVVYVPPESGECVAKLEVARELLNLRGHAALPTRARQQLMALLLNVAVQYLHLSDVVSEDGATVSQAITFCDRAIDDPEGNHELAKDVAETINEGGLVPGGIIPLDTENIAYARPAFSDLPLVVSPNPGGGRSYTISFGMPATGQAMLQVYDVAGRKVAQPVSGPLAAGRCQIEWNGRTTDGRALGPGVYFVRLTTPEGVKTTKFVHLGER